MTRKRWEKIEEYLRDGSPLKDIDCYEDELIAYILELREALLEKKNLPPSVFRA